MAAQTWHTIGEPVLDLKIQRRWKSNAQLRAEGASKEHESDAYTARALQTLAERMLNDQAAKRSARDQEARTSSHEVHLTQIGSLRDAVSAQRKSSDAKCTRDYAYLRDNIDKSEARMKHIRAGISLFEVVQQEETRTRNLSRLVTDDTSGANESAYAPALPHVSPPHLQLQLSQPPRTTAATAEHNRRASMTFGGTGGDDRILRRTTVVPLDENAAAAQLEAFAMAAAAADRHAKLQRVLQQNQQVPLPADLRELLPELAIRQQQQQQRALEVREKLADAQRSATSAPSKSSVVVFSPPSTESGLAKSTIVDMLRTSRAALAEPLYAALVKLGTSASSPRAREPHPPNAARTQTARGSTTVAAGVSSSSATLRSLSDALDTRLRAHEASSPAAVGVGSPRTLGLGPLLAIESSARFGSGDELLAIDAATTPTSSARRTWHAAQRDAVKKIDSLRAVCGDFDARKQELGRSLNALVLDLEVQRSQTLQRKLSATHSYAYNSLAADFGKMRFGTQCEQRRLLLERHCNYMWFEKLVRKLSRGSREFEHAEIVLLLHIRSLFESVDGFYVHPSLMMQHQQPSQVLMQSPQQPPRDLVVADAAAHQPRLARRASVSVSFAHALGPAVQATADWSRLEANMQRVLRGCALSAVLLKPVIEICTFVGNEILKLPPHRLRSCLETIGEWRDLDRDELLEAYALTDRHLRSAGEASKERTPRNKSGEAVAAPAVGDKSTVVHAPSVPALDLGVLNSASARHVHGSRAAKLRNKFAQELWHAHAITEARSSPLAVDAPARQFASGLAAALDSARTCLPESSQRLATLTRIDALVHSFDAAPMLSSRAAKALPRPMQDALAQSLTMYVSAMRQQRHAAGGLAGGDDADGAGGDAIDV